MIEKIKNLYKKLGEWEEQEVYIDLGWYGMTTNNITIFIICLLTSGLISLIILK